MHIHFSLHDTTSFEVVLNLWVATQAQYSNFLCSPTNPTIKPLSIEVLKKGSIGTYQKNWHHIGMYHTLKIGAGQKIRFGLNGSLKLVMHA